MKKVKKEISNLYQCSEEEFNEFYDKNKVLVKKVALSVVKNEFESEDIVQIVFAKIYNMPKDLLPINNKISWLYRVTKNVAIDYIRKKKNTINIDEIYTISDSQNDIDDTIDKISYNQIISNLSKKEQEIISLKVVSGLSFKQIGKLLDLPTSTVSWIYYRSMKTLKILLGNIFITLISFSIYAIRVNNIPKSSGNIKPVNEVINTITISTNINKYIVINNVLLILSMISLISTLYFTYIFIKNHKRIIAICLKNKEKNK